MKLTITDPGSLLPVILDIEITDEQAQDIINILEPITLGLPEPMTLDQVADVLTQRVAYEEAAHGRSGQPNKHR